MKLIHVSLVSFVGLDCLPLVVDKGEEAHYELAVHAVSHATVTRNGITKVLDVECSLKTGSEETTEGGDERCESRKDQDMELDGAGQKDLASTKYSAGKGKEGLRYAHVSW